MKTGIISRLARLTGRARGEDGALAPSKDEAIRDEGEEAIAERREMIKGVEELGETTVKAVMVPRTDAFFLPLDIDRAELVERVAASGHSRIPVYRGVVDEVVGILYAKDLLRALVKGGDFSLADLVRKPFFVPETKRIDSLFREMKRRRVHIAVAVDEYGGVSGIVFLEDIIEEIVGEIDDEFDEVREAVIALGDGLWLCDAMAGLDEIGEALGLSLPVDEFETLGGYLFDLFGRIPSRSEGVTAAGAEFTVQDMHGNRITSVRVRKLPPDEEKT
jgi:CBS domain containing-hemolysin-like protein